MAYERTNWQNGDVISSEKLNKMEAGIEYACSLEHKVTDPVAGQVLRYDEEEEKFVNADVAIETNIQNPTDGQTLKYDAASGKWVNAEGGSGTLVVNMQQSSLSTPPNLDRTWQEIHDAFPNVIISANGTISRVQNVYIHDDVDYIVTVINFNKKSGGGAYFEGMTFEVDSANGYPAIVEDVTYPPQE